MTVLVGGPDGSVAAQQGCARALFAGKTERARKQPVDEPFEPHRDFHELSAEARRDAIDHSAAHHRLADAAALAPRRPMTEQIGRSPPTDNDWDSSGRLKE